MKKKTEKNYRHYFEIVMDETIQQLNKELSDVEQAVLWGDPEKMIFHYYFNLRRLTENLEKIKRDYNEDNK